uniref:G_PROTEIN_RECEP_F1_2 domain-containing protein n=1 Tax=Panagrellus redivivus TaxID=6233 RepID=A0A7E4W428_PANRE
MLLISGRPFPQPNLTSSSPPALPYPTPACPDLNNFNMANGKRLNNKRRKQLHLLRTQQLIEPIAPNEPDDSEQADESQMNDDDSTIAADKTRALNDHVKYLLAYLAGYVPIIYVAYKFDLISRDAKSNSLNNPTLYLLFLIVLLAYWLTAMIILIKRIIRKHS